MGRATGGAPLAVDLQRCLIPFISLCSCRRRPCWRSPPARACYTCWHAPSAGLTDAAGPHPRAPPSPSYLPLPPPPPPAFAPHPPRPPPAPRLALAGGPPA